MSRLTEAREMQTVALAKDLVREIKRGHAWLFSHAVERFDFAAGTPVRVVDRRSRVVASGISDAEHPIPVRICQTEPPFSVDDAWLISRLELCMATREQWLPKDTTGYRLVAGEGDGVPGLIVDVYGDCAVIKLDGGAPEAFYRPDGIARWLAKKMHLRHVVRRPRNRDEDPVILLQQDGRRGGGGAANEPDRTNAGEHSVADYATNADESLCDLSRVPFLENGMRFGADVLKGQKTGFFLDQRDNRELIRHMSNGKSVLNLFSYNGGFSIAAGLGGAQQVTSVDLAAPAIAVAEQHWNDNDLPATAHHAVAADCFQYLDQARSDGRKWDLVISDPPSFARNVRSRPAALNAYGNLASAAAKVTTANGLLALASCSSQVGRDDFLQASIEGIGRARRKAFLISERGLPVDHPTPVAMPELRYLKFFLFLLN